MCPSDGQSQAGCANGPGTAAASFFRLPARAGLITFVVRTNDQVVEMRAIEHRTKVYDEKAPTEVSWHQAAPEPSLRALDRSGAKPSSSFIDVGGGASNLVDALLTRGWQDLTVLDIAASAVQTTKARLGPLAEKVHWEVADITEWRSPRKFDVWHDRAVFHFLTDAERRAAYRRALMGHAGAVVRYPGGLVEGASDPRSDGMAAAW